MRQQRLALHPLSLCVESGMPLRCRCGALRCTALPTTQPNMAKYIAAGIAALFVTAEGLELTPDNFEAEVKGSKNAFVKFQAPW
jgi:hypothetical protein